LRGRLDEVRAAGAELVFVGCGTPAHAASFERRHVPECRVLTDPTLEAHRRLGLKRSVLAAIGPRSIIAGARATLKGHPQTVRRGDPWQQGALFAVVPGGEIVFAQRNSDASDRPDLDGALRALAGHRRRRLAAS
jgi:alkyl-hydroperoxide reductase/thiol specific antioxidant family protein